MGQAANQMALELLFKIRDKIKNKKTAQNESKKATEKTKTKKG